MANAGTALAGGQPKLGRHNNRWAQLAIGIVCMGLVANLQYAWTLFVVPMDAKHHWGQAAIQTAFTIFIVTETWLVPLEGWLVDKFGPRPMPSPYLRLPCLSPLCICARAARNRLRLTGL